MSIQNFTEAQLDAALDAQEARDDLKGKTSAQVAATLKAEGHELFTSWGEGAEPGEAATAGGLNVGAPVALGEASKLLPVAAPTAAQLPDQVRAPAGAVAEGFEGLDAGDFAIPYFKIRQPGTEADDLADVADGLILLTNDPEGAAPARRVVFLTGFAKVRALMLPYAKNSKGREERAAMLDDLGLTDDVPDDASVLCRSPDRVAPVEDERRPWGVLAKACGDCQHSKWGQRRQPPACNESYVGVLLDVTDGAEAPARFRFGGSSIRPVRSLLTALFSASQRNGGAPMHAFAVEVTTAKGKGDVHYTIRFGRPQLLEPADVEAYGGMRQAHLAGEQEPAA